MPNSLVPSNPYRSESQIRPIDDYSSDELLKVLEKRKYNSEIKKFIDYLTTKQTNATFLFKINYRVFANYYVFYEIIFTNTGYYGHQGINYTSITKQISDLFNFKYNSYYGIKDNKHFRTTLNNYKLNWLTNPCFSLPS